MKKNKSQFLFSKISRVIKNGFGNDYKKEQVERTTDAYSYIVNII